MRFLVAAVIIVLSGCSPAPPPDSEVIAYFERYKDSIAELAQLGVAHPVLRRVEPSQRKHASYYGATTAADVAAEERAYAILTPIRADYVSYWRNGAAPGNPLVYVEVPFYRWGLSLGGYAKSLRFFLAMRQTCRSPTESFGTGRSTSVVGTSSRLIRDECLV
jgi:hypothetical protein